LSEISLLVLNEQQFIFLDIVTITKLVQNVFLVTRASAFPMEADIWVRAKATHTSHPPPPPCSISPADRCLPSPSHSPSSVAKYH